MRPPLLMLEGRVRRCLGAATRNKPTQGAWRYSLAGSTWCVWDNVTYHVLLRLAFQG